jgi:hypothetical protein
VVVYVDVEAALSSTVHEHTLSNRVCNIFNSTVLDVKRLYSYNFSGILKASVKNIYVKTEAQDTYPLGLYLVAS